MTDTPNGGPSKKRLKHAAAPNCILKFYSQEYFTGLSFGVDLVCLCFKRNLLKNKSFRPQ